jgi:uncharacterized protein YndB with AHSA1/START domain
VSTERSTTHDTFVLERSYPAAPARVFAAWSDAEAKLSWFAASAPPVQEYVLDFRVGGREFNRVAVPDGPTYTYEARYEDIVAANRIVYSYYMLCDDVRISVSVTTVEFRPEGEGTRLVLTEQGVYLDGEDKPEFRRHGVGEQLDALGVHLAAS